MAVNDDTSVVEDALRALGRRLVLSLAPDGMTWTAAAPSRFSDVQFPPSATGASRHAAAEAVLAEVRLVVGNC